jgi:hypothetical protein
MGSKTGKVILVLGAHAHVPYGAADSEFEHAYARIMRPFVSTLYKYPGIQAALHYSGSLLYWVERTHPELFMLIEDMVSRRQAELLGGGFYEPMLPLIPLQDKIGQIELFTTYLRKQFGKRPQGCWLPALAWEQNLVGPLASCGMTYTFLSGAQFARAGLTGNLPCLCEDQGKLITVFPITRPLQAAVGVQGIAPLLQAAGPANNGDTVITIFPSGGGATAAEPDAAWAIFFEELSRAEAIIETATPGKLLKSLKGLQKAAIPETAAADTEGTEAARAVFPPRRFIVEYPEANGIYAKMIFTGLLIGQLRGDKSRKLYAREELWKAQGCALFESTGPKGLGSRTLRGAAYRALLAAERISREKGRFAPSLIPYDFNLDGSPEWLFQEGRINSYIQAEGGGVFELDYLPSAWNYLNTVDGRLAFQDRLLPAGSNAEAIAPGAVEGGRHCRAGRYDASGLDKARRQLTLTLAPDSSLPFGEIEITKTFMLKKDALVVCYRLTNRGRETERFVFAPEIDLSLPGEGSGFARFFALASGVKDAPVDDSACRGAEGIKVQDLQNEVQIVLASARSFDARIVPLRLAIGGSGEAVYQAACLMPFFALCLESGGIWENEFSLKFSH